MNDSFKTHPFWREEIPMVPVAPMVKDRYGWLHSGHWERGSERVDYITHLDTHLLYLRYTGDTRLVSGWQTAALNQRITQIEGEIWTVNCPFCCTNTHHVLFYRDTLRCKHCLRLETRWSRQARVTYKYRAAIRKGELTKVKAALEGTAREKYLAMLAMELCGISPKKLTSPKQVAPWKQSKYRSISK